MSIEHDTDILFHYALGVLKKGGGVFPQEYIDQLKEVIRFKLSLNNETDRGCALMAASLLEHRITELLRKNFVEDKSSTLLLSPSGPLGAFSNKIDISYALALIPQAMKRDLHLLRKIRNIFAHTTEVVTFDTPAIKDRCFELQYAGHNRSSMHPRECFTQANYSRYGLH